MSPFESRAKVNSIRILKRRDIPEGLWTKCDECGEIIYNKTLEEDHKVCPKCDYHFTVPAYERVAQLADEGSFKELDKGLSSGDPLKFKGDKRYVDQLKRDRAKVSRDDCMQAAHGAIGGRAAVILVQDFQFMGGSLGMAAGEAFVAAAQEAVKQNAAFICVTASGGARMQEGMLSLMQMPRTTLAVQELAEAGLPYIVILTDPTTGGVAASYAMLGDVHIAEPGALIGFTGPRVIEQTIRQKLPEGFQRAEFQLDKGMVDMVVDRRQMRDQLAILLDVLMARRARAPAAKPAQAPPAALPTPARKTLAKPRAKAAE